MSPLLFLPLILCTSCALVTAPVKILGKAATTTIDVTGKAAGAGFSAISGNADE